MKIFKYLKIIGIVDIVAFLVLAINDFFTKGLTLTGLIYYSISIGAGIYLINFPQETKDRIISLFENPKK